MLDWLPAADDLSSRIKDVLRMDASPAGQLSAILALTQFNRDMTETDRIDRLLNGWLGKWPEVDAASLGLSSLRLAILASHSVGHLLPAIRVSALGRNLLARVHAGAYGSFRQALLGDDAELREFKPQAILLALDSQAILSRIAIGADQEAERHIASAVLELRHLWRQAREKYGAQVIQQSFLSLTPPLFGSFDALVPASPAAMVLALNQAVRAAAREDHVALLDVEARLPPNIGGIDRVDMVRWHHAKQLINPLFAPLYGDHVARILAAIAGRTRKCLVLDLDNTLWGGVIGDDGPAGIRLGQGSAEGEAYLAFQHYVDQLRSAGIILAVCSKNDDSIARQAFEEHGEMVLKYADIACFRANWSDKAENIRSIAGSINIGLDSLVFVDDNPAERAIVRRELPEVAVPEMPADIAHYPASLAAAGYFEAVSLTADDLARAGSYAANAQREALSATTDLEGYLKSLEMTMLARPVSATDLPRAAQLINKTNQFNLTTRRRTAAELEAFVADAQSLGYCFRLRDRFGDNGLISVILARPDPALAANELLIDSWLMSCRVLGRGVETAAFEILLEAARERGFCALVGEYRPTERNGLVAQHYEKLGFVPMPPLPGAAEGTAFWRRPIPGAETGTHHIALEAA